METNDENRNKMSDATPKAPPLVRKIDLYIKNDLNVLLIGPHGVGKTFDLLDAAKRHGKKLKYFSCATMDPYTDLVGIPYPSDDRQNLHMVRPREIDQADIIFFDELNRAPDMKTLDAILEVVQFRSINGEPLNASAVWASINPVDDDKTYNVKELDPALVDRFDVYEEIRPMISLAYFNSKFDRKISIAIKDWWTEHSKTNKADYISPRRMEKIAQLFTETKDASIVAKMMPPGGKYDHKKLEMMLKVADGQVDEMESHLGAGSDGEIQYDPDWLANNSKNLIKSWKAKPANQETARRVLGTLSQGIGAERVVRQYGEIIDLLPVPLVEGWFESMDASKKSRIRTELRNYKGLTNFKRVTGA